jgi:hypothetical protein
VRYWECVTTCPPGTGLTALAELGLLGEVVFGLSHGGAGSDPDGLQDAKVQAEWMIQQRKKKGGGTGEMESV